MKKLLLSIFIGFLLVTSVLSINILLYNNKPSNITFLLMILGATLLTPIITALIASIGQTQFNRIFAATLSATITGVLALIPFYFFLEANTMSNFIENTASWGNGSNNTVVEIDVNLSFSGFVGQLIYWVVAGTITGAIVNGINKRKTMKVA